MMVRTPLHLGETSGSTSYDVVSYCTSCSFCGRAVLAWGLPDDLSSCSPHVHFAVGGIVKPLMLVAAPARLKDAHSAPSPHGAFRRSQFGRHFFRRQQACRLQVLLACLIDLRYLRLKGTRGMKHEFVLSGTDMTSLYTRMVNGRAAASSICLKQPSKWELNGA
jgi:hypothetical protein